VAIFRIFFNSMSAVRYMDNRLRANVILGEKMWAMKKLLIQEGMNRKYSGKEREGANPAFSFSSSAGKVPGFEHIYELETAASWDEKGKSICIRRILYSMKM